MNHPISYSEYKRRVFNTVLTEAISRIHLGVLNGTTDLDTGDGRMNQMAKNLTTNYVNGKDGLNLGESTISATKEKLKDADYFILECMSLAESIADEKSEEAKKDRVKFNDEDEITLSDEDNALIDQIFDTKGPQPQIDQIRDATAKAMLQEEEKAKELQDAVDIAKAKVASGEDPKALEETSNRLKSVGPTSLMNGLMVQMSTMAIKDINESGNLGSIRDAMVANRDRIKSQAAMTYALIETVNVMGIQRFTKADIEKMAKDAYYYK